jgi:protein-disulfide isomerase
MTYAATFIMFVSSILILKNPIHSTRGSFFMSMMQHVRKYGLSMALIVIILGAGGMGIGAVAKLIANEEKVVSLKDRVKKAIRQYETARVIDIDTKGVPLIGKPGSPARFTVFFDFTCDHCRGEILLLERITRDHPGAVSVYFKYLPLNGDCGSLDKGRDNPSANSCIAAAASYCAYKQGRFMDYAKSLFELYHVKGTSLTSKSVRDLAQSKNMVIESFDACFASPETKDFIARQYREAERLGVASTPTLYLNGKLLTSGSRRPEILDALIRYCLRRGN